MRISLQEIMDYQKCPMLYKFRWIDKIDTYYMQAEKPNRYYVSEYFDMVIHKTIYSIFYHMESEEYPSAYFIKKRWGTLWNKDRMKEDVVMDTGSWRNEVKKREMRGLNTMLAIHEDFMNNTGTPIIIAKEYTIKIAGHELTGVIELVREKDGVIELFDFKTIEKHNTLLLKSDLEVTAASYAFRQLFGYKEDRIVFYKTLTLKKHYVRRDEKDYKLLAMIVNNVANAIQAGFFYPVLNSKCNECPFQKHCAKQKWLT